MAPVCSNCSGTDFVWSNELKTGMTGGGTLSIRARGEIPLGTRICRTCGHADLFLRDISILHQPHNWRPGEFIPIVAKPAPKPSGHHASGTHASPAALAPSPPAPGPTPPVSTPAPIAAPPPPPAAPTPPTPAPAPLAPAALPDPPLSPALSGPESTPAAPASPSEEAATPESSTARAKAPAKRRPSKPKS